MRSTRIGFLTGILLLLISLTTFGQDTADAKLLRQFQRLKGDALARLFDSLFVANEKLPRSTGKVVSDAEKILRIAENSGSDEAVALAHKGIARSYFPNRNERQPLEQYRLAYELSGKVNDTLKAAMALELGTFFNNNELYPEAREKVTEAISLSEKLKDSVVLFHSHYVSSLISYNFNEYPRSISEAYRAIAVFSGIKAPSLVDKYEFLSSYNTMGLCHTYQKEYDSALVVFAEGERKAMSMGVDIWVAIIRAGRSKVYVRQNRLDEALKELLYQFRVSMKMKEISDAGEAAINIADIYRTQRKFELAKRYLDSANLLLPGTIVYRAPLNYWQVAYRMQSDQGKYKEALAALKQYNYARDSVFEMREKANLNRIASRYELRKKDGEIDLLTVQHELSATQIASQNMQRNLLLGSIVVFIFIVVQIYIASRNKQRANRQLASTNETIESQQEALRAAVENLQQAQERLVQSEKMASLGQMTAGIAHEVNNPLNFIAGGIEGVTANLQEMAQMVADNKHTSPAFKEAQNDLTSLLEIIFSGVQRITRIIHSLLTFSGPQKYEMEAVDIHAALEVALTILAGKIKTEEVTVVKDYGDIPTLQGNETQLSQVFLNILDNAIFAVGAIDQKRTITISTSANREVLKINISDNGAGIPHDIQKKIMDPFFTTKEVGKGTGLGLSISLGIIGNHHGNLRFVSTPGKGTTFTIELPLTRGENEM